MARIRVSNYPSVVIADPEAAEQFKCTICLDLFTNPVQIGCKAGHVYCGDCVAKLRKNALKISCPMCREECLHSNVVKVPFIERQIKNLKCKCPNYKMNNQKQRYIWKIKHSNSDNSKRETYVSEECEEIPKKKRKLNNEESVNMSVLCDWIGAKSEWKNHYLKCQFGFMLCQYCKTELIRKDTMRHYQICTAAPMQCEQCKQTNIARNKMDFHIQKRCSMTAVECHRCKATFLRRDSIGHSGRCIEKIVHCTYQRFGCNATFKRKDMGKHEETSTNIHLQQVKNSHLALEARLNRLEKRFDEAIVDWDVNFNSNNHDESQEEGNDWWRQ